MRRGIYLLLPVLAVGVVGGLIAIGDHQSDAAFLFNQDNPRTAQPRQFEVALTNSREPLPSGAGLPASGAHCVPGTQGPKRNPWKCTVRYGSGHKITYLLTVAPDGSFKGSAPDGTRVITGCCVTGGRVASG